MQDCKAPDHANVEETLLFGLKQKISSIGFANISIDEMKNQIEIYKRKQLSRNSLLYVARCLIMFGNKYDYSKVEYEKANKKICIICPEHGEFWQTPNKHREGRGCPECGREQLKKTMIDRCGADFIRKCKMIHGNNRYDYSKVEYNGSAKKVLIKCNECGNEFYQTASGHLSGYGCIFCSESHMEKRFRTKLESFGLIHGVDFYKEYSFPDLFGINKCPLRYDFFIPSKNLLIELDGIQHYESGDHGKLIISEEKFAGIKERDKKKNDYANNHDIKLLRIRYDKFDEWINNIKCLNDIA